MALDLKVRQAFNATRALGIPDEEVKPLLKNLLKLYGKNWALIEEDNFRTLLDAYFEKQENKNDGKVHRSTSGQDDSERSFKRPHLEKQENQDLSTVKCEALEGDDELSTPSCKFVESTLPSLRGKVVVNSELRHTGPKNVMKESVSSRLLPKKEAMTSMRALCSALPKNSMGEAGSNQIRRADQLNENHVKEKIKSKVKHSITTLPNFTEPTLQVPGICPQDGPSGDSSLKSVVSPHADIEHRGSFSGINDHSNYKCFIDIASSSLGEVKISLNCRPSLVKGKFLMPKLDAVMKFLEEKYWRSLKIVGPQFSASKLLKDLCDSYLDLGCDSSQGSAVIKASPNAIKNVSAGHAGPSASGVTCSKREFALKSIASASSIDLASASQRICNSERKKHLPNLIDITKGAEKVKIYLVDDSGNEHHPEFNYIPQNIIYQNAHVQISLARIADEDCCSSCIGDCLSSRIPCACARETGGEFAYTAEGQLKDEFLQACKSMKDNPQKGHLVYCHDCPIERSRNEFTPEKCKGHLLRKFIKECWRKCGCDMRCGNRVVQRGITCDLQVFWTPGGKGWGVRTVEDLPKGTFVCEYVGEVVTNMELYDRNMRSDGNERHTYPVMLDADWGSEGHLQDEDALCLDATYHGNVARFINHRCSDANLIDIPVEVETPDRHYYHLAFFTSRKVGAFEELTWDYGIDFDDHNHPVKAFKCCCGSPFCRDMKKKRKLIKAR